MTRYALTLPPAPSVNHYWTHTRRGVFLSERGKAYKQAAGWDARSQGVTEALTGAVAVTIKLYQDGRGGDVDNNLKCLLDCLNGIAYEDDSQIVELHVYKYRVATKARRVEMVIEQKE